MGCAGSKASVHEPAGGDVYGQQGPPQEEEDDYNPLTQDEVNARIVCSESAELFPLGNSGVTLRYAYLSQRGYYPEDLYKANQDAFKIVRNFNNDPSQIFFGVFDGHGVDGDQCSYYVRDNIEAELKSQMKKFPDDFERAYKESFLGVNVRMHDEVLSCALLTSLASARHQRPASCALRVALRVHVRKPRRRPCGSRRETLVPHQQPSPCSRRPRGMFSVRARCQAPASCR